jgi:chemotaxis protein MotB
MMMRALRLTVILGGIYVFMSCATQPKAVQEDPRIGQLQGQVSDLQKQVADKDATIDQLKAGNGALADLQKQAADKDATIKQLQAQADDLQKQLSDMTAQKKSSDDQVAAENERIRKIQSDLDAAKEDDAEKIAELDSLKTKLDTLQKASTALSADLDSLRSGSTKAQADYLAQIDSLNKANAELQDKINDLTKQQAAFQIAAQKDEKDLEARIAQLKGLFSNEIARGDLDIRRFRDILIVSVKDSALFPPDSPALRPETMNLLKKLSEVFKAAPDRIVRIEGNTAVAISSPEAMKLYPTSWHLGAARAANVAQYLQEKCGMDPQQIVATSLGEFRPRADNSTESGKAQNRRVDFVLIARAVYEINQLESVVQ